MLNKWLKIIIPILVVVGVITFVAHSYVNYIEKKQIPITIAKNTEKTLFFYRDDCPDCQSIFHQVYWKNVLNGNVLFINMNQEKNHKYIKQYNLNSVPTFIHKNKRYTGTNLNKIWQVLEE